MGLNYKGSQPADLTGQKFGRLTALEMRVYFGKIYWRCKCKCGTRLNIRPVNLRKDKVSCGCLSREISERAEAKRQNPKPRVWYQHKQSKTRLYRSWAGMKSRCHPTRGHKRYAGRGITVCDEWSKFMVFQVWALANGYQDDLEIDRINNDGNYEPSNCRWVTHKVNMQNRNYPRVRMPKFKVITLAKISVIKKMILSGERTKAIAEKFGVTVEYVKSIKQNKIWTQVA